jgi:intracellular septation protein
LNQLLDFLPILLFVAAFFGSGQDIYLATGVLMAAVALQVGLYYLTGKPVGRELKLTFWASMIFGALTLLLRNELFIQWKPTVVNWALAAALLGSHWVRQHNLLKSLLGEQLRMPEVDWQRLNYGWAFGFFLAGALNLLVAYNFSMEFWVSYKLIGGFGLTFLYIIITLTYLARRGLLDGDPQELKVEQDP